MGVKDVFVGPCFRHDPQPREWIGLFVGPGERIRDYLAAYAMETIAAGNKLTVNALRLVIFFVSDKGF